MIAPDTSVVIAALAPWHVAHRAARAALLAADRRLIAHVAFETTSALSRMPAGHRLAPAVIVEALGRAFPRQWLSLDAGQARAALQIAVDVGVRGGALYDALIAATAGEHDAQLISADRRAQRTYDALGIEALFIDA